MTVKCAFYGFENLDGICSASILVRWARLKGYKYRLAFFNYGNADTVLSEIKDISKHIIFVLDISPQEISKQLLEQIKKSNNKVIYWNSHLACKDEAKAYVSEFVKHLDLDPKCSAHMTYERFMPTDKVCKELANIAHDMEFWLREDERSSKLADLIASGMSNRDLVETLSRGVFWSAKFETVRSEYLVKKDKAFTDLIKNMNVRYHTPYNFGYTLASSLLSTADAGQKMLDSNKVDVSVCIYKDGRLSFRRADGVDVDLSVIAALFAGGGHPYAAGGKLSEVTLPLNSERFKYAVEHIDKTIREYFQDLENL